MRPNMKLMLPSGISRRALLSTLAALAVLPSMLLFTAAQAQTDPLSFWNDGPAKQAIIELVKATTDRTSPQFVPPEARIATFDQDGTTWVSHPMYTQVMYCLERVPAVVAKKPELKNVEPFKTVLSGNREAMAKLSMKDLEKILVATLTGMTVDEFKAEVTKWIATAKHPRWDRLYTELTYQPMLEVMRYLRANGFKTYIVTGGGQDFVRVYSERVYGIPPEQVVGTAGGTKYGYDKSGKPFLTKEPKLLLNDNNAGKPEGIHLMIGRRPTSHSAIHPSRALSKSSFRMTSGQSSAPWPVWLTSSFSEQNSARREVVKTSRSRAGWVTPRPQLPPFEQPPRLLANFGPRSAQSSSPISTSSALRCDRRRPVFFWGHNFLHRGIATPSRRCRSPCGGDCSRASPPARRCRLGLNDVAPHRLAPKPLPPHLEDAGQKALAGQVIGLALGQPPEFGNLLYSAQKIVAECGTVSIVHAKTPIRVLTLPS
jgi:phosphoglycolate phosphatase-like HAD superfamily hydrolase